MRIRLGSRSIRSRRRAILPDVSGRCGGNTQISSSDILSVGDFNNYQVVLDTTGANWAVTYLINGPEFSSYTYTGGNPTIGAFGFGSSGTAVNSILGEVNEVELSMIPEPTMPGLYR